MDEQVEILRAIWNEMKALNGRVSTTNSQLEQTNARLEENTAKLEAGLELTNARLEQGFGELKSEMVSIRADINLVHRRSVDRDLRLGTSLTELGHDVRELTHLVHDWRDEHRLDRADLHERVERLERRVGVEPR
jgi:predicted  nucleic acid-binding Zn-ribbon protein